MPKETLPIHFITINYNCHRLNDSLIRSIVASGADFDSVSLTIVNNSVNDDDLRNWFRTITLPLKVQLLEAGRNLGFGSGCNLALRYVWESNRESLAWLINPDARLDAGAIDYVRQCLLDNPHISMLGTRIRDHNGDLWFSQGTFNRWSGSLRHRIPTRHGPLPSNNALPTRWISGCSMVFRLSDFDDCPQFDPQYFLDYEDADISERLQRLGYRLGVTESVLVEHQVSAITQRVPQAKYQHATFSKLYFLHRHATPLAIVLNLVYYSLYPLSFFLTHPQMAKGRWLGLADYLRWCWRQGLRNPEIRHPRTSFTASS